jgi:hypothetical protein
VNVSVRVKDVLLLSRDLSDQVLLARLPVILPFRAGLRDLLFSNSDPSERSSLVSEKGGDSSGVDPRDSGDAVSLTPLVK